MMFSKNLESGVNSEVGMKTPEIGGNVEKNIPTNAELRKSVADYFKKLAELSEKNLTDSQTPEYTNPDGEKPAEQEFSDLSSMKKELGKTYSEIKENKPLNSPNIAKWFDGGGKISITEIDGKQVWKYTDAEGKSVQYIDGYIKFPPEAKNPTIADINIGKFTGDRNKDKQLYLEKLEEEYGLTDIPDGYSLHHDTENGVMQLIKDDYHKRFTHAGGYSMFKEDL